MALLVLNAEQTTLDIARMDEILGTLDLYRKEDVALIREHLQGARTYLLGAMPNEYIASLRDARSAAGNLSDKGVGKSLTNVLDYLLEEMADLESSHAGHQVQPKPHGSIPTVAHSYLWGFFSTADISFGVFYPKGHIMAVFPSFQAAKEAETVMLNEGFGGQEVMAIHSDDMLQFLDELRLHAGLWGILMSELSRMFGTEEIFVLHDIRKAGQGAGFLAVFCPLDSDGDHIPELLVSFGPLSMQRYMTSGIRSLMPSPRSTN
ncbi:MAG: hypothetical protein ABI811_20165 [Acidobacteriota bacterium]